MRNVVTTTCSATGHSVTVDIDAGVARVKIPSNGIRGARHVPAHVETVDLTFDDSALVHWECPMPGCDSYEDSVYESAADRAVLA